MQETESDALPAVGAASAVAAETTALAAETTVLAAVAADEAAEVAACGASQVVLDHGVLRLIMNFLPTSSWCTILPAVFARAQYAAFESKRGRALATEVTAAPAAEETAALAADAPMRHQHQHQRCSHH